MSYYNTTQEKGNNLSSYREKAATQDRQILSYMIANKKSSASILYQELFNETIPITSVRRSLSNLFKEGKITKTLEKNDGIYGRPEIVWRCL